MESPYRPGFGVRPKVLAGREMVLSRAAANLTRVANSAAAAPAVLVLTGARGLGKTVTLGEIATIAAERGFLTCSVSLDSVSDNIQLLAGRLAEAIAPVQSNLTPAWEKFLGRLSSLSIELNAGLVKIASRPPTPAAQAGTIARQALADLLTKAAQLAHSQGKAGLVVLIDELQEAPREQLVVLSNAIQDTLTSTAQPPIAIFAAGLPTTAERVMAAASFTERFDFRILDRLDQTAAERALLEPSLGLGVTWRPAAAELVLAEAAGAPYLIQRLGDEAWLAASPTFDGIIEPAHAQESIVQVRASLGAGLFRGRWAKATPAEQALLVAIAQVADFEGIARTRDITAALNRTTPQLSGVRKSLIDKGLIESRGTGLLRFTMPGFAGFVLEHLGSRDSSTSAALPTAPTRELPGPPAG